jgi:glycosyltransferase involved in cell wall biosynthesis
VRHGVDHRHFRRALDADTIVPDDLARLPRPILGFFGLIAEWVDLDLIAHLAARFPKGSVVLLGKATVDLSGLARFPNIHLFGRKPYADLPAYGKGFDVALMPFVVNELTLNANPLKVREYLAAGLPVVSTPIPEVEALGLCRIASGPEAFASEVESALADPGPRAGRSDAVRHEGWDARIDEIRAHLAELERDRKALAGN